MAFKETFQIDPLSFYEYLLRGPMLDIYKAKKTSEVAEIMSYSDLLIDKFSIHSSTFFHLSQGIIEHRKSGEKIKMKGYDLFTINSMLRVIIETYLTFHHIYCEPKTDEERELRFLLWKADGLKEKSKFKIEHSDFAKAKEILENDKTDLKNTCQRIEENSLFLKMPQKEIAKIYKPLANKFLWKFLIEKDRIKPKTISDLVAHICKIRAFINFYKYASIHTHSNFWSIEEFKTKRGKPIPEEEANSVIDLAIFLTTMIIIDITAIDDNADRAFKKLPSKTQEMIFGISSSIRKS